MPNIGLDETEIQCFKALLASWEAFLQLAPMHQYEYQEFRTKVHELQAMILSRPTIRNMNLKEHQS